MSKPELPPCHPAAELFPLFSDTELSELAEDIAAHGLHEPVEYLPDGRLLDGRNRHLASQLAGIEPNTTIYEGDDPTSYVISKNVHRRHLQVSQKSAISLKAMDLLEAEGRQRMAEAGASSAPGRPAEKGVANRPDVTGEDHRLSRDKAAALTGTSGRSVARAKRIRDEAPDLFDPLLSGDLSLGAAEQQVKQRLADKKSREDREEKMVAVPSAASGENWWMLHGDFQTKLKDLPAESVDLLITDPPDPHAFLPIVTALARNASRLLVDGGIAVVRTDLPFMHEVIGYMTQHLAWGWLYVEPSKPAKIVTRQVRSGLTVWLAFSKGTWPVDRLDWHDDMLESGLAAPQLIDSLSRPVGTVLDPFAGNGGFGVAAREAGRPFMGCEIDPQAFQKAVATLTKEWP